MERTHSLTSFSDDELLRRLSDLLGQSRRDEADLVAHIGELCCGRSYVASARHSRRLAGPPLAGRNIVWRPSACSGKTTAASERPEKGHEAWLLVPGPVRRVGNRALAQSLGFHFEIDLGIYVGGVDRDVP